MSPVNQPGINPSLLDDFQDFFEHSRNGYLATDPKGFIIRHNTLFATWTGVKSDNIKGKKFSDFLPVGGKIYYETHLSPLLRLQGFFDEVALELVCNNGDRLKVIVNGYEKRNEHNEPLFIGITLFKANDRFIYEENLRNAKTKAEINLSDEKTLSLLREQFIAVLGHDLRNPLSSIMMGVSLLQMAGLNEEFSKVLETVNRSSIRMKELISDVMDFARSRMGGGISLQLQPVNLVPVFEHVVAELQATFPARVIKTNLAVAENIICDAPRLSQLLSNLLANALTHGASDKPVYVNVALENHVFEFSVANSGSPIPASALEKIFLPFTRESTRPSQQGLGLGLFIASEIAHVHGGELSVISNETETRFTFTMKIS